VHSLANVKRMSDWLYSLSIAWRALVVFGITYLVTAAIQVLVTIFSVGEGAHSFKEITPGILAPLGAIFQSVTRQFPTVAFAGDGIHKV
jgi:hypothetical protein